MVSAYKCYTAIAQKLVFSITLIIKGSPMKLTLALIALLALATFSILTNNTSLMELFFIATGGK